MRKEIKDIVGLLIIVLPACIFLFVWWLHSPMYEEVWQQKRLDAQTYLMLTYSYDDPGLDKQAMIDHYGFTDEDINPSKILERFIESQDTANKTETYRSTLTIDGYFRNLFREVQNEGVD